MGRIKIFDDLIWAKHIEGDTGLRDRIVRLPAEAGIDIEVDGVSGRWMKARDGSDGRPTLAIKPVGEMREVWKRMQARRGEYVAIRQTMLADSYLAALRGTLGEWDTPEDDEAFRDL